MLVDTTAIQGNQEIVCSPLSQGEYPEEVMKIYEMRFAVIHEYSLSIDCSFIAQICSKYYA